jgi:methyl-accepting chemotaxis protein
MPASAGVTPASAPESPLDEIVISTKRAADVVAEIAAAAREQSTGLAQIEKAIMQMDPVTQSNAAQTEELASTTLLDTADGDV